MTERRFKPRNTDRARKLRNEATPAKRELWKYLSRRQVAGRKFSRQMPIGRYFGDFVCRELQLVVELDGLSHDSQQSYDEDRTTYLERNGYRVIRFNNGDIFENIEGVVIEIEKVLTELDGPTPDPSRLREGGN